MGPSHCLIDKMNLKLRLAVFRLLFPVVLAAFLSGQAYGAIQFDVFLGYDGVVPQGAWFPVVCEIKNDEPTFKAVIEFVPNQFSQNQVRRVNLELPTGTLKRVIIPVFSPSRYANWTARLLDDRGKIRAEKVNFSANKTVADDVPLMAAICRSIAGSPTFPNIKAKDRSDFQPVTARYQSTLLPYFPDHPIALDGLSVLFLNPELAVELSVNQVNAIQVWLHGGGHLIVGLEGPGDVNAVPWLKKLLPCDVVGATTNQLKESLQSWLTSDVPTKKGGRVTTGLSFWKTPSPELLPDTLFGQAHAQVALLENINGTILSSVGELPLMVSADRGRGRITVLAFSPERQPFLTWKNRGWFWVKLVEVPTHLFSSTDLQSIGGPSIDGVFGAMIESKQIRKLPLHWLLLLLVAYLIVIGPLDHYWLKKINKQMWTWVTFPMYVVFFSGLIYFIGFKLRAGDSEYNELQIVDVMPRGNEAVFRGRTYMSIYSPSNARYNLAGKQNYSAFRGEFLSTYGGGTENSEATIQHLGNGFSAEVFVPVWTSQLYESEWVESGSLPMALDVVKVQDLYEATVSNLSDKKMTARMALKGRIVEIGELQPGEKRKITIRPNEGMLLRDFVTTTADFHGAVQSRGRTFGDQTPHRYFSDLAVAAMASSFLAQVNVGENQYRNFNIPRSFDLSDSASEGGAVLLAWVPKHGWTESFRKFNPTRSDQNTLLRLTVSIKE